MSIAIKTLAILHGKLNFILVSLLHASGIASHIGS